MCRVVCVFVVCGRGGASVLSLGSLRPGLVSVGAVVGLVASVVLVWFRLSLGVFPGAVAVVSGLPGICWTGLVP